MGTGAEKIKVLIVDDHQVVRQGLRTFLDLQEEIEVVGEAADGQKAVELAASLAPDIILMDLVLPVLDGVSATVKIKSMGSGARVIALTSFTEDDKVFPAIQAGASSYLLKDVSPEELVDAIKAAHRGEARLHPQIMRKLIDQVAQQGQLTQPGHITPAGQAAQPAQSEYSPAAAQLTPRELEVIRLVAQGKTNREIAQALIISETTAKAHISNILAKLELVDRTQMAIYAIKTGLVDVHQPES